MIEKNQDGLFEVSIDDGKYEFEKWGADDSLMTLLKIAKVAGKPLGLLVGSVMEGKGLDQQVDPDMIGKAFEAITENMDEKACFELIKKLCSEKVMCDGKRITFNTHYQQKLPLIFKVVKANLEVQYGNFSDAFRAVVPKAQRPPITNQVPAT